MEVNKQTTLSTDIMQKKKQKDKNKTMRRNEACIKEGRKKNNIQFLLLKWNDRLTDL